MRKFLQNSHNHENENGQSLVEMALITPILILLLIGAADLGRAFYAYTAITNAAREGARYGASYPSNSSGIVTRVQNEVANSQLSIPNGNITSGCNTYTSGSYTKGSSVSCSAAVNGDFITVNISYPFNLVTSYIFKVGTITLSSTATMAIRK